MCLGECTQFALGSVFQLQDAAIRSLFSCLGRRISSVCYPWESPWVCKSGIEWQMVLNESADPSSFAESLSLGSPFLCRGSEHDGFHRLSSVRSICLCNFWRPLRSHSYMTAGAAVLQSSYFLPVFDPPNSSLCRLQSLLGHRLRCSFDGQQWTSPGVTRNRGRASWICWGFSGEYSPSHRAWIRLSFSLWFFASIGTLLCEFRCSCPICPLLPDDYNQRK